MGGRTKATEESDHDFFARLDSVVCGIRDSLHILRASVQLCGCTWVGQGMLPGFPLSARCPSCIVGEVLIVFETLSS